MARQWVGTPTQGWDGIWHYQWYDPATGETGEELSYEGPTQAAPVSPFPSGYDPSVASPVPDRTGTWNLPPGSPGNTFNYGASLGNYPGTSYGTPWNNPMSIGAGVSEIPYGWGVGGFGQSPVPITPANLQYLFDPRLAPGYIPGSSRYNQFDLSNPQDPLFRQIAGQTYNTQFGSGGVGDPTTGAASEQAGDVQSRYRNAGQQLFQLTGPNLENEYSPLGNLIGRAESPSGLSTVAIPQWAGPLLVQAIQQGRLKPTTAGQQFMSEYFGIAPQQYGNASAGGPAAAGGGGATAEQNALASIAAQRAAESAAQIAFTEWNMRTGDERLAMEKAQQAWSNTFQTETRAWSQNFQQKQQEWLQRQQTAEMLGTLDGQQTLAAQQQYWNQRFQEQSLGQQGALGLLGLQSSLQGPRDWARYWGLSASAPQGLKDALASLGGRYQFAPGQQGTPGAATLQSRTQDLLAGGNLGAAGAATDGAAGQASNPWQWSLSNWTRMSPSMQQGLLGREEAAGQYGPDVEALLRAAAPRYTAGAGQAQVAL